MMTLSSPDLRSKLILRGIRSKPDAATKRLVAAKAERLFRHEPRILRLRIDVERDLSGRSPMFIAKGRIEIAGPDLTAAATSHEAGSAVNRLIGHLDRMLRKRASHTLRRRDADDIREHGASLLP
jgi:putative sigma-54 modulation protein